MWTTKPRQVKCKYIQNTDSMLKIAEQDRHDRRDYTKIGSSTDNYALTRLQFCEIGDSIVQ